VKGAVDAGLEMSYGEEALPSNERIEGTHIAKYAKLLSEDPVEYEKKFSKYLERNLKPEDLPEHFKKVKAKIMEGFA
jgi:large subunit ribosomal protein L18